MKADYVHKDSRTLEEKPQVFTRWIDTTIEELKHQNQKYKEVIDKIQKIINTEIKLMGYAVNDSCLMLIQDILNEVTNNE